MPLFAGVSNGLPQDALLPVRSDDEDSVGSSSSTDECGWLPWPEHDDDGDGDGDELAEAISFAMKSISEKLDSSTSSTRTVVSGTTIDSSNETLPEYRGASQDAQASEGSVANPDDDDDASSMNCSDAEINLHVNSIQGILEELAILPTKTSKEGESDSFDTIPPSINFWRVTNHSNWDGNLAVEGNVDGNEDLKANQDTHHCRSVIEDNVDDQTATNSGDFNILRAIASTAAVNAAVLVTAFTGVPAVDVAVGFAASGAITSKRLLDGAVKRDGREVTKSLTVYGADAGASLAGQALTGALMIGVAGASLPLASAVAFVAGCCSGITAGVLSERAVDKCMDSDAYKAIVAMALKRRAARKNRIADDAVMTADKEEQPSFAFANACAALKRQALRRNRIANAAAMTVDKEEQPSFAFTNACANGTRKYLQGARAS